MTAPTDLSARSQRAFPAHACAERYFAGAPIEAARKRVEDCVLRGDGPAVVIGAAGMGKTMLVEVLAEGLRERFGVVKLTSANLCSRRALLQAILFGMGMPYRKREEGDLRLSLLEALEDRSELPHGVALLVDESQLLAPRLLEELRVLSNLAHRGEPVVRLVLIGGPALEETLAAPELDALNQRVAARCYLNALSYDETRDYVRGHVAAVGADPDAVFSNDGLDAVFQASDGVPRLISQVCDRALRIAVGESRECVDAGVVQSAWSDIHQIPAPWQTPSRGREPSVGASPAAASAAPQSTVVEFGALDDDPKPTAARPEPRRAPVWNADAALGVTPEAVHIERAAASGAPFDEEFQEEEVVIDRFSGLETAFRHNTPRVTNTLDSKLSRLAETLARPTHEHGADERLHESHVAEAPVAEREDTIEYEEEEVVERQWEKFDRRLASPLRDAAVTRPLRLSPQTHLVAAAADNADDDADLPTLPIQRRSARQEEKEILIVEDEVVEIAGVARPTARRQEYRQLFAKLRHG